MISLLLRNSLGAVLLAAVTLVAAEPAGDRPREWPDPATAPAELMPLADKTLLLDVVRSGDHYVTVGSRGDVLLSADGRAWRQVEVPTRATLTAVAAIGAQVWAVGHDGMILHSADGGEHWQIQRKDPWLPNGMAEAARDPKQGAPLLDVLFIDARRGFAIGAYSLALRTDDGGQTWKPMTVAAKPAPAAPAEDAGARSDNAKETFSAEELKLGEEPTPHLNAIARTGSGALLIVAERGSAFRSRDDGASWTRLQLPYDGSMFDVLGYEGDHVLVFGLRGHAFESTDLGDHWTEVPTGTELSLMGGAALPDGGAVIAGANGIVLMRTRSGEPLRHFVDQPAGIIATALPQQDAGVLLLAGENGISTFEPK
jgi:photosystem II stability/assembly factor-like uncharacterized protein